LTALVIAVIAGLFLAFGGAFGTADAPLGRRLAYWLVTMVITTAIAMGVSGPIWAAEWGGRWPWVKLAGCTFLLSFILTPVVWLLSIAPFRVTGDGGANPWRLYGSVLVISAAMTTLNLLAERRAAAQPAVAPPVRFLDRLPPRLRGAELYAVEAEDHYLRLHTSRGSDLILLRLSDAMAELEGLEGTQTHRSWWVARGAVQDVQRGDGRAVLKLKGDVEAPVSRTFAKTLREKGWY
jgi:hypothetical protein